MSFLYLNAGYGNLFDTASQDTFTQNKNVANTTGLSFSNFGTRTINIPNLNEIWVRIDLCNNDYWQKSQSLSVKSANRKVHIAPTDFSSKNMGCYINGNEQTRFTTKTGWTRILLHVKSGVTDGIYEVWENEILKCSFTGNILNGEDVTICEFVNSSTERAISNIIVSDSPIKWTENVIVLPTSISATMTDNGDGTYSASNSGEYVKQTIDGNALRNSHPDNTVITGICVAGRPAYYDGEGIDVMQVIEGDTVLGERQLSYNENISITYGKRVNMPISSVGGTYGWKAK